MLLGRNDMRILYLLAAIYQVALAACIWNGSIVMEQMWVGCYVLGAGLFLFGLAIDKRRK
jgi:hypothetical protein